MMALELFVSITTTAQLTFHKFKSKLLNLVWKHKRPQIAKTILRKKSITGGVTLLDSKLDYKATLIKTVWWGFPGGAVVGSPPANAGDTGSGPGLGKSHMPRSN